MNVLRKFKLVFIAVLALLFSFSLASCNKVEQKEATGITDDDESFTTAKANISESGFNFDTANLSSIEIDVSKAKTTFFLGEDFSSEGVVVKANFLANIDGERVTDSFTTTDFTVDYSDVDLYNIGTYPVEVTYRYKAIVYKKPYKVNVISSELAASGEEYVGGIDVKYNGDGEYTMDLGTDFNAGITNFTVVQHTFKGYEEQNSKPIAQNKYSTDGSKPVLINASSVNKDVRGDYVVKVEYTPDAVEYNGKTLNYKVSAFIIVHVIDPVTKLKFVSGTKSFSASANDFDYSDWKFSVTRKNSGVAEVDYNATDFVVKEVVPFVTGKQIAYVYYMDYTNPEEIELTITESTTYDIVKGNIYDVQKEEVDGETVSKCVGEIWSSEMTSSAVDFALDSSGIFKITKPTLGSKWNERLNSSGMSNDVCGSLYFGNRPTIKGAGSYISVEMKNPGILVVYAAGTNTTDTRDVCVYDAPDSGEEIGLEYVTGSTIKQFVFNIEKAGTYYIQSFEGGIYVHGLVVAIAK